MFIVTFCCFLLLMVSCCFVLFVACWSLFVVVCCWLVCVVSGLPPLYHAGCFLLMFVVC